MRILVTGGAGFIGSHIAEHALERGWDVAVLDDFSTGKRENIPAGAEVFEMDLRHRAGVLNVLNTFQPQAVSHQAAQASVALSVKDPHHDAEINILGSINLLDACVENGVERFVFASTGGAIYGEVPEGTLATLETPPSPISPYAASKFAVENYLRCYEHEHGLQSTVLRYSNVYGPRQDPHGEAGVVAIFLNRMLAGEPIRINAMRERGDDGCIRDYVHVDDVVRANLAAFDGSIVEPILNVCTGIETTTKQLADALQQSLGINASVSYGDLRPGDIERSVLCARQFEKYIGRTIPRAEGLAATSRWFRDQH